MVLAMARTSVNMGRDLSCKYFRPTISSVPSLISPSKSMRGGGDKHMHRCPPPPSPKSSVRGYHTTNQLWQHHHQHQSLLAHEWVVDGKITASMGGPRHQEREVIVFLHGLLGNAKNLRTPAKILTRRLPQYDALLLDVRGHGGSSSSHSTTNNNSAFTRPHNMQSCVEDVIYTLSNLGLHGHDDSPSVICGHSLGGRIALQYTHSILHAAGSTASLFIQPPKQTWILDSVPGVADPSVSKVLSAISSLSTMMTSSSSSSSSSPPSSSSAPPAVGTIPTKIKSQITTKLIDEYGLDNHVATWIVSSLRGIDEHSQRPIWAFDIDIAMELVQNFTEQDVVRMIREVVESTSNTTTSANDDDVTADQPNNLSRVVVQLVMAGKNESWTEHIVSELQSIQSSSFHKRPSSSFKMHTLDKAGHWVHVDDLDGLMKLMVDELG